MTGSRDWTDDDVIADALIKHGRAGCTVVQGCARGADQIAASVARSLGYRTEDHPAFWSTYGRRAGFVRNKEMVDAGADLCLAFIKSRSRGATMCADLAEAAGITTVRFTA